MDNNTPPKLNGLGKELGQSGVIVQHGIIRTDEYNSELIGRHGLRTLEQMRRSDATIHAILQMCKLPLLGLKWSMQAASETEEDLYRARYIEEQLMRVINWHRFQTESLTMLDFGYCVMEKTLKLTEFEGKVRIGIDSLGFRKQTSIYSWETKEQTPGVTQQLVGDTISIPRTKLIVFTHQQEGDNYEGVSMLRYAYKDWYMKDTLVKVNGISLEKAGIGVPVVTFDTNVQPAEKENARAILRQMRGNEENYLEIPENSKIEMLDMKGNTTKDILPTIKHHDHQIALSVLGQFLMLGQTSSGSRATSKDHSQLFLLSEEALANLFQSTVQEQLIKQLCDLNFSDMSTGYPQLQHSRIQDEDVAVFATAVSGLMTAGVLTMNFETENAVRQITHLPELTDDYEADYKLKREQAIKLIKNPPAPVAPGGFPAKDKNSDPVKAARIAQKNLINDILRV